MSYEVSVWRDAGGGSWFQYPAHPGNMWQTETTTAYPFVVPDNCTTPAVRVPCGQVIVDDKAVSVFFVGKEARTRSSIEVVTQPTYGLTDLLVRSAFTATFLTLAAGVLRAAVAWVRRNVRVVR